MAAELKGKKRRSADVSSPATKKSKKSDDKPASVSNVKHTKQAKSGATNGNSNGDVTAKTKASRKRASDAFEHEEENGGVVLPQPKKTKKTKVAQEDDAAPQKSTKSKGASKAKKQAVEEPVEEPSEDESDDEIDDQTAALLKGFESDDEDEDGDAQESGNENGDGIELEKLPEAPTKNVQKQLKSASKGNNDGPGVVYIGRIPHGFYEHQMKAYFEQFGDITRLRLARNKKTGRSKHFAFIEFKSAEVAEIMAKTMNNYLLFQHLLKVRVVPPEQVHKDLFKGAGSRFKVVPRNKMEGRHLRLGMDRDGWERRLTREETRRVGKSKKLQALGYEFVAPQLKGVGEVPLRTANGHGENRQVGATVSDQGGVIDGGEPESTADASTDRRLRENAQTGTSAPGAGVGEGVGAGVVAAGLGADQEPQEPQPDVKKSKGAKVAGERNKARKQKSGLVRPAGSKAVQKA